MKKLFLLLLPLLAVAFTACSKDDDGESGSNSFTINGKPVNLTMGTMFYVGPEYSSSTVNIDLVLLTSDANIGVGFELNVPNGNTKPPAHTYHYDGYSYEAFTISDGAVFDIFGSYTPDIIGGTVTIAVSGSTYTISVNCTLDDGETVKGTYKGSLGWYDMSEY